MRGNYKGLFALALVAVLLFGTTALSKQRTVVKRIRFALGRTTSVVKGAMRAGDYVDYRLDAKEGQTMTVHLTARRGKGRFQVGAVSGPGPYQGANMVSDWQGKLLITGTHLIILYADSERLDYTLEVTIH
jgi:hypothetical protein